MVFCVFGGIKRFIKVKVCYIRIFKKKYIFFIREVLIWGVRLEVNFGILERVGVVGGRVFYFLM